MGILAMDGSRGDGSEQARDGAVGKAEGQRHANAGCHGDDGDAGLHFVLQQRSDDAGGVDALPALDDVQFRTNGRDFVVGSL